MRQVNRLISSKELFWWAYIQGGRAYYKDIYIYIYIYIYVYRERGRERDRQTDRQTERDRERQRETETERHRQTESNHGGKTTYLNEKYFQCSIIYIIYMYIYR